METLNQQLAVQDLLMQASTILITTLMSLGTDHLEEHMTPLVQKYKPTLITWRGFIDYMTVVGTWQWRLVSLISILSFFTYCVSFAAFWNWWVDATTIGLKSNQATGNY